MKKLKALFLMMAMSLAITLAANETTLETSSPASSDKLGNAIAISGDYMVVGASNVNKAVVFKKTAGVWGYDQTLTASDAAAGDEFGASVAIDGDVILVGSPGDDDNGSASGSVYVFERSATWPSTETQKITAANGAVDDKFGVSVAVDASVAFIGSYHDSDGSKDDSGTVYIYTKATTWDATTTLVASDSAASYKFGHSIAVNADGDRLAIGSPAANGNATGDGAVYIFEKTGGSWGQAEKLVASDGAASDTFGSSVSISGLYVAVGSPAASSSMGKAYIFEKNSTTGVWSQAASFSGAASSTLGSSVYINGSVMIAGAPGTNAAYIYERGTSSWSALTWSYTSGSGSLGTSVALQNNFAFAGAPDYDGTSLTDSGAVFIKDFTLSDASILFNFDDEVLATLDGTTTDTGSTGFYGGTISGTGYAWEYIDGYNNLALVFGTSASAASKITGLNVDFGQKFVLETNIWKGDETTGQIDLVKTTDTSPTSLKWYVSSDGKMHLDLNDGTNSAAVYTSNSVLTDKEWTKLYTVVDLSQSTLADAIKMYGGDISGSSSGSLSPEPTRESSLLLHLYGIDDSATDGNAPHTVTTNNTVNDTTNYKFGPASRAFNGSTSYLSIPDSPDWDIYGSNSDNWTIDLWVKHTDHSGLEYYLEQSEDLNNRWYLIHHDGYGIKFVIVSGGTEPVNLTGGEITDTNWHHIAVCKVGSTYGLYKDGIQLAYDSDAGIDTFAGALTIASYNQGASAFFDGNIDELRISKSNHFDAEPNSSLTDTITVPTAEYQSYGEIATGTGSYAQLNASWSGYTCVDRTFTLTNGYTLKKLGFRSDTALTLTAKIVKRNSAGNYTKVGLNIYY